MKNVTHRIRWQRFSTHKLSFFEKPFASSNCNYSHESIGCSFRSFPLCILSEERARLARAYRGNRDRDGKMGMRMVMLMLMLIASEERGEREKEREREKEKGKKDRIYLAWSGR